MKAFNAIFRFCSTTTVLAHGFVLAGLLACVSVNAATKSGFYTVPTRTSGNTAQIGYPGAPPAVFPGTGNVNPVSGSGWYTAGNYGVAPPATGPTLYAAIDGSVAFAGVKYPWQAGYQIPKSGLVSAAAALLSTAGGPYTAAALFAAPFLLDWLTKAGGRITPSGEFERQHAEICITAPCYEYRTPYSSTWYSNKLDACARCALVYNSGTVTSMGPNYCAISYKNQWGDTASATDYLTLRSVAPSSSNYLPSSMDDIAPYMAKSDVNPDGRVIQELLDKGADIPMPAPTVTGPASVVGSETTTVNPDGTKTVSKTTYNFNTSGDTITNTSNVTTTNNYNSSNVITGTTSTTVTPVPQESKPSECEKNPDSAGCQKTDIPTDKVPTKTETITWAEENLGFGAGSCPSPVTFHTSLVDGAVSFAFACDFITTYVRPLMILMALLGAFFIVAPIREA